MRSGHIGRVRAAILAAAMLLLGAATPFALGGRQSVEHVSAIASGAQTREGSWSFDDGLAEALISEVIIILVCAIGCGLLLAGLEAFDLWREQREEKAARLHPRIANAPQRDGLLGHLAVTPILRLPLWGWSRATIELRRHVPNAVAALRRLTRHRAGGCHDHRRVSHPGPDHDRPVEEGSGAVRWI